MKLNWEKMNHLIPAVIQDEKSKEVLMLGYMNEESLQKTRESGLVTFFSRSKQALWTKGETSGHHLNVVSIKEDCDGDALLITANPVGPTCHRGTATCFDSSLSFIEKLDEIIAQRIASDDQKSYVRGLVSEGPDRVIQKVGEEAIEVVIAAKNNDREEFIGEASDLLFHLMVLLQTKGLSLKDLNQCLYLRQSNRK